MLAVMGKAGNFRQYIASTTWSKLICIGMLVNGFTLMYEVWGFYGRIAKDLSLMEC
jgi:hypothetical protein